MKFAASQISYVKLGSPCQHGGGRVECCHLLLSVCWILEISQVSCPKNKQDTETQNKIGGGLHVTCRKTP